MTTKELFDLQFESRAKQGFPAVPKRREQLNKIHNWILDNRQKIREALYNDFSKSYDETDLSEIYPVITELKLAKKKINNWVSPKRKPRTIALFFHSAYVNYEPKGVVLIIAPWNYPFLLAISPLISAIAAGNSVILKPSEISSHTSSLIKEMITELFSPEEVAMKQGNEEIAKELLLQPFDHIFFTGSTSVGIKVAKCAAESLISTTLELGGKSPTIIDNTAKIEAAAEKIVWGKFLNKGQTCIAPDYLLIHKNITDKLVNNLIAQIKKMYGEGDIKNNPDYAKIISDNHHQKLTEIINDTRINGGKILYGGKVDFKQRFIEPTLILTNCKDCKISDNEIFGPILPLIEYSTLDEAIDWINSKYPPLTIYIFSSDKNRIKKIANSTQSGGIVINDVVLQFSQKYLPFGGVKQSGIGRSHGYEGFKSFCNQRSYLKSGKINFTKIIYPPFTPLKRKFINILIKYL